MEAKEIYEWSEENGDLSAEFEKLNLEWNKHLREITIELGETDDPTYRANKANEIAHERYSGLATQLDEIFVEIARRKTIMETVISAGWASQFEREQLFKDAFTQEQESN